MSNRLFAVSFFLLTLASVPAAAQDVQVPFDLDGNVMIIDYNFASRAGLFQDVSGFYEARLFRQDDGGHVLEISYREGEEFLRRREVLTEGELESLRASVHAAMAMQRVGPVDQSGRTYLLRRTAAMSYLVYGPSVVGLLDIDDGGTGTAVALVTGSAGFFIPYLITRDRPVPMPAARMAFAGSGLGYVHGLTLALALGGEATSAQAGLGSALAFSLGEAVAGYRYGMQPHVTEGTSRLMTVGGWYGLGIGSMAAMLTFRDVENLEEVEDTEREFRTMMGLGLTSSVLGVFAGDRLARGGSYTLGDASILGTAGAIGLYNGLAFATAVEPGFKGGVGMTLAGTLGGLGVGYALTRETDFSESQANYVDLGTGAGGLLGGAIAQLVDSDSAPAVLVGSALGSAAGFALMYFTYRPEAMAPGRPSGWRFDVAPVPGSWRPGLRLSYR